MPEAWTDDLLDTAQRLWDEGRSAAQIAAQLGFTRNAVVGAVYRNRARFRRRREEGQKVDIARKPARIEPAKQQVKKPSAPKAIQATPAGKPQTTGERRTRPTGLLNSMFPALEGGPVAGSTGAYRHRDRILGDQEPVPFAALKAGDCKWPLTDFSDPSGPDMPCCGAPTLGSYCEAHRAHSRGRGSVSERQAVRDLLKLSKGG